MGYQKTPTMGYQKAPTPSTIRFRKKPNTAASKVSGAGLSNTNEITKEESIDAGDNGIMEGFSNNNNIKGGASSGGSGAVRGNGNSKGMSSSGGSGDVRGNFHSKGMSSSGRSGCAVVLGFRGGIVAVVVSLWWWCRCGRFHGGGVASTVDKLRSRLSKWKVKTLSIGGRLTLLKAVLGASPLYNMSIFKDVPLRIKCLKLVKNGKTHSNYDFQDFKKY
uniref:RNA-directed DNA polymerase, eukaryota n=1 Tax=Tanacetum cinerariifolium TaxID=118510 RepID=A0A6L2NP24_TANCI|nr:RNA-directed DNA polymerase, eukaryota [Tanacetum cinerariifolium]